MNSKNDVSSMGKEAMKTDNFVAIITFQPGPINYFVR
jgi:hypothetical protein